MLDMEEYMFDSKLVENDKPGILQLEHSLLDVAANEEVAQGVFYMLPFLYNDNLYIRHV